MRYSKRVYLYCWLFLCCSTFCIAQEHNAQKTSLTLFITRVYNTAPFDIKVVEDHGKMYLFSAVVLDPTKYKGDVNNMLRVASMKASSQASKYYNEVYIKEDVSVITTETVQNSETTITSTIKEKSAGFVGNLEQYNNFTNSYGGVVYIYGKEL